MSFESTRTLPPEHAATVLRERIYGGIACLSTLLVIVRHLGEDVSAREAAIDVAVAAGGLWAAGLFADYMAHLVAHGRGPRRDEKLRMLRASSQILQASAVPLVLLIAAGIGLMPVHTALNAGVWVSLVTLGLFALLAARRTKLSWWKSILLITGLVALGAVVVVVKTYTH